MIKMCKGCKHCNMYNAFRLHRFAFNMYPCQLVTLLRNTGVGLKADLRENSKQKKSNAEKNKTERQKQRQGRARSWGRRLDAQAGLRSAALAETKPRLRQANARRILERQKTSHCFRPRRTPHRLGSRAEVAAPNYRTETNVVWFWMRSLPPSASTRAAGRTFG